MILASQLVGKVQMDGATTSEAQLKSMGERTDNVQQRLNALQGTAQQASSTLAGRFASAVRAGLAGLRDAVTSTIPALASLNGAVQGGRIITGEDVARAKLQLIENKVTEAREKLFSLQGSADAGQAIRGISQAQAELTLLEAEAQDARTSLAGLGSQASKTGSDMASGLGERVKQSGRSLLDFGSQLGMTVMGVQSLAESVLSAGQALFAPIMSSEQLGIAFTTLTGSADAASKMIRKLTKFADETAFEPDQVERYAAQLIGMKVNGGDVIPILTSLGDALYGVGHGNAEEMGIMVDLMGQIRINGRMMYDDIGQMGQHGVDALGAMSAASGLTTQALSDMASNGGIPAADAIKWLTKGIEMNPLYQGGMAKQANSLQGILSTMSGYVDTAVNSFLGLKDGQVVAGSLFETLKNGFGNLSTWLQKPDVQKFASDLGGTVGKAIQDLGGKVGTAAQQVGGFISSTLVPAFQSLQPSIAQATQFFQGLANSWMQTLGGIDTKPIVDAFVNLGSALQPSGAQVGVFMGYFASLQGVLQNVATDIAGYIAPVVTIVTRLFSGWRDVAVTLYSQFQANLLPALQNLWNAVQPIIKAFLDWASTSPLLDGFFNVIKFALGILVQWISFLINILAGAVTGLIIFGQWIVQAGQWLVSVWQGIPAFFQGIWDFIIGIFQGAIETVVGWFKWLYEHNTYFAALVDTIRNVVGAGLAWLRGAWETATAWLGQQWGKFSGMMASAWSAVSSTISGAWNKYIAGPIGLVLSKFTGWATDLRSKFLAWGGNMLQGFIDGIKNKLGDLQNMLGNTANEIAKFLGFHSPTEEGPGRESDTWAPNLVKMFAQGLEDGQPEIQAALNTIMKPLAIVQQAPSASAYMPSGARVYASGNQNTELVALLRQLMASGSDRPVVLNMDGRTMARGMMPYWVDQVREKVGTNF